MFVNNLPWYVNRVIGPKGPKVSRLRYVFLIRRERKPVLRCRASLIPRSIRKCFRSKRVFRSCFNASLGNIGIRRRTGVHLFVLSGPKELAGDQQRKLIHCGRGTRERWSDGPFESHSPVRGPDVGFRLGQKFGCRPRGRRTGASRLSPVDGHRL